jgi:hypothetical protein
MRYIWTSRRWTCNFKWTPKTNPESANNLHVPLLQQLFQFWLRKSELLNERNCRRRLRSARRWDAVAQDTTETTLCTPITSKCCTDYILVYLPGLAGPGFNMKAQNLTNKTHYMITDTSIPSEETPRTKKHTKHKPVSWRNLSLALKRKLGIRPKWQVSLRKTVVRFHTPPPYP